MSDLGWCAVFFFLMIAFLGSEMSLYEDLKVSLKQFDEQDQLKLRQKQEQARERIQTPINNTES